MTDTWQGEESHRTKGLLRLTMACNERCPFCNVPMEDYPRPTPLEDEVFAELDAFDGQDTLTISGGEPTLLRKRLLAVICEARSRGISFVELQTNAVLIDSDYAAALAEAGLTSAFVSLLSHVPEHHDALAGLEGAFPRCIAGIRALASQNVQITLNPVTASRTQELFADYVDFVAAELPFVKTISVSAVQPHGRAAQNLDLLPDYAVLADTIRAARERAEVHGLMLVNPYCGLPACIGWEDALDRCVEAFEAREGGWSERPGIENQGDKRHGPPCRRCVLRSRCGGAWHAYWDHHHGSGISAPVELSPPWIGGALQDVVRAFGSEEPDFSGCGAPTVWLWTDRYRSAPCTDLALEIDDTTLGAANAVTRALRNRPRHPRLHLRIRRTGPWAGLAKALAMASILEPETVWLPADTPAAVLDAARSTHPGLQFE